MHFKAVAMCCLASHMAVQALPVDKTVSENKAISSVNVSTPALNHQLTPELTKISRRGQDNVASTTTSMTRIYITSPYTTYMDIPATPQPEHTSTSKQKSQSKKHKSKSKKSRHTTKTSSTPTPTTIVEVTQTMTKTESPAPVRNTGTTSSSSTAASSSSVDVCDVYPLPTCAPPPEDIGPDGKPITDKKPKKEKRPEDHDKNDWTLKEVIEEHGDN